MCSLSIECVLLLMKVCALGANLGKGKAARLDESVKLVRERELVCVCV